MSPIRVLVVDDSVVVRRLVTDALSSDPAIEVTAVAANGQIALAKAEKYRPDVITMDIEMPVLDGIGAVRELRRAGHRMPIIMFSTLTERGASATLDALASGATDYVTKPANVGSVQQSLAQVAEQLIPRIKAFVRQPGGASDGTPAAAPARSAGAATPVVRPPVRTRPLPDGGPRPVRAVVLGSSTGGPEALSRVLSGLTAPLPVPMLVVQHMPPVFTTQLAARLDRMCASTVVEAAGDEPLRPGTVYVAPGDRHLEVVAGGRGAPARTRLNHGQPVNFCRPAVDVLFRSAVAVYGGDLLAVVLTGMGSDGRAGCTDVVSAGGHVVVQDEASSVVWGMPGSVALAGMAHAIVPIDEIASTINAALKAQLEPTGGGRR